MWETLRTTTYEELLGLSGPLASDSLLLIDGHSLLYRAYYGIRELTTRAGLPVNAVFGFYRVLLKTLRDYPSEYVTVVFDAAGPTFRHELFEAYKANRKPMPEDLVPQLPLIRRLLEAMGLPVMSVAGVEADDVLASLARLAAKDGLRCLIATSDKDMAQIVTDRVSLLRPAGRGPADRYERLDPKGVEEKYGVPPDRIADWLSLIGDVSDNVPGVPGIGEKTATRLLQEYGSLDDILSRVEELRNARIQKSLVENREAARVARELILLRDDVPVEGGLGTCRLTGIDRQALTAFLTEMEFRSALDELGLSVAPADEPVAVAAARDAEYTTILDQARLETVIAQLQHAEAVSVDLETTSRDPMVARIVGIALSGEPYRGFYVPVGHDALDAPAQLDLDTVLKLLRPPDRRRHAPADRSESQVRHDHPCTVRSDAARDRVRLDGRLVPRSSRRASSQPGRNRPDASGG